MSIGSWVAKAWQACGNRRVYYNDAPCSLAERRPLRFWRGRGGQGLVGPGEAGIRRLVELVSLGDQGVGQLPLLAGRQRVVSGESEGPRQMMSYGGWGRVSVG